MALRQTAITDFTNGELSSKFNGRFDLDLYRKGVQVMDNWIPFTQGGAITRPPTQHLAQTKSGAAARLIDFVVNKDNAFVLEFTNNLIRIWKDGALVGAPTEVVTTYTTAQLFKIQVLKVNNVLYIVHYSHVIRTLTWTGGTSFTLAALTIDFADDVDAWASGTAYSVGDYVTNGSPTKIYECITAGTSAGSGGPTTEADDITDNTAHWYWVATKPFSQSGDYPAAIGHFDGRMCYGGGTNHPQRVYCSEPFFYGDFNLFNMISYTAVEIKDAATWSDPLVPETQSVTYTRPVYGEGSAFFFEIASESDDEIYWLLGADALIIGTSMAQWIMPKGSNGQNIDVRRRAGFGNAFIQALMFQEAPILVQGNLSKAILREFAYTAQNSELQSPDLSFGADHMLENGITQMAVMRNPQPTVFCVTNNELACLLYNKPYGVIAWYHISLDTSGDIESVCVIPGSTDDEVYVVVNRENGREVEKLDLMWDATSIPLDSYVDVASIAGATQTGLDRFDGTTVTIYNVDDSTVHTAAVAAGSLTYPAGDGVGDHVVIGMPFTCRMQTMRLEQGQIGRSGNLVARVRNSMPFKVGAEESTDLQTAERADNQAWTASYSGDVPVPYHGDWSRDVWAWLIQDATQRTTILALFPEVDS